MWLTTMPISGSVVFPEWLSLLTIVPALFSLLFPHLSFLIFDTLVLEGYPHLALESF